MRFSRKVAPVSGSLEMPAAKWWGLEKVAWLSEGSREGRRWRLGSQGGISWKVGRKDPRMWKQVRQEFCLGNPTRNNLTNVITRQQQATLEDLM